jgi:hypothetical protein
MAVTKIGAVFLIIFTIINFTACAAEKEEHPPSTASTVSLPDDEKVVQTITDNSFIYEIHSKYAEITGYVGVDSEVIIPPEVAGVKIMSVGRNAFSYNETVKRITLPVGITNIADYAFTKCTALEYINFPDTLISIGTYAFRGAKLTEIILPASLTSIGKYAFAETLITTIKIPYNIVKIGDYAFSGCSLLTSFELPPTMRTIPKRMFYSCASLTEVIIPEFITAIDDYAFGVCTNLTSITIPSQVNDLGEGVFYSCPNLTIITPSGSDSQKYAQNYAITYVNE